MTYFLYTDLPAFWGDICDEIRLFCPIKKIECMETPTIPPEGVVFIHRFFEAEASCQNSFAIYENGILLHEHKTAAPLQGSEDALRYKKFLKRAVKNTAFTALKELYKKEPPWGSLTGIRPTKLMRELIETASLAEAKAQFQTEFFVSEKKAELAAEIVKNQIEIIRNVNQDEIDVYIGIPFCVSKCAYCSFASATLSKKGLVEEQYVEALLSELNALHSFLAQKTVRAIYVGGGTPTAFTAVQLDKILAAASFPCKEFTVEAGRPDTIDREKLDVLKKHGVTRISVNAQTTNDETLRLIGRNHTAADFFKAFALVKQYGFDSVNTDIIIGLPNENTDSVIKTIEDVTSLAPENITVHSLAIKRSSAFGQSEAFALASADVAQKMLEICTQRLNESGYIPYYMYRQKYMTGNLENIGYAKPGKISIYNIDIMEECVDIAAFGAGAISKRIFPAQNRIERAPNVKDILHYLNRTDEMAERKRKLFETIDS